MGWESFWGASEADVPLIPKSRCVKKNTEKKQEGGKQKHDCVSFSWGGGGWKWKLNTAAIRASENRLSFHSKSEVARPSGTKTARHGTFKI